jgi:hypothetical protein
MTEDQKNGALATVCLAALLAVPFYFSFAGMRSSGWPATTGSLPIASEAVSATVVGQRADGSQQMRDSNEKDNQDARLATATEYLVYATGGLVLVPVGLVYFAFVQARDFKRFTGIAERALTDLEAPFVFVDVSETGLEVSDGMARPSGKKFTYQFTNYGRTPANLTELLTVYRIDEGDDLPSPLDRNISKRAQPSGRNYICI